MMIMKRMGPAQADNLLEHAVPSQPAMLDQCSFQAAAVLPSLNSSI